MEKTRQSPDRLLRTLREETGTRGKLKIFFGYAAGVGKTYAMLEAAHQAKARGVDVVAGYIEPHGRAQTEALLEGLEALETKQCSENGVPVREFDIDAALARRPALILVDELAHTNALGSRNAKRYQDVQELLRAGIDVYTTVNVQHIESLNDQVSAITGILVRERIPDAVFDGVDQVELVDIEPEDLLTRLADGDVYRPEAAERAAAHFFTAENLTALRELALRRCAEQVNLATENARIQSCGEYYTGEHILVCLSPSPSNARLIRTAARMARAFKGRLTALYVETPGAAGMDAADKKRLQDNIHLAEQLGASVETTYGEDVPYQIAEFARLSGVSKVVIGRSTAARYWPFGKPTLTERLIADAPNLDIYVIPDARARQEARRRLFHVDALPLRDLAAAALVLFAATSINLTFYTLGFSEANIIAVYLFAVLVCSAITTSSAGGLLAALVSVLIFNFFFTAPRFTFMFNDPNYLVTMPIMFMVALMTGSLATRLKNTARQSARAAFRTKLLFETNQLLQRETSAAAVRSATAAQLTKLLGRDVVVYACAPGQTELSKPEVCRAETSDGRDLVSANEQAVAVWVVRNNKRAGATTGTLGNAECLYHAIRAEDQVYGVVGVAVAEENPLDPFENSVLLSILGECALALENICNIKEKEDAAVMARNEQLRANLLRAISHDLRTPLTSIAGSADNLLAHYKKMDDADRLRAFTDIYDDSQWLIGLVENLLAITRIEGGQVSLSPSVELIDEVVAEALRHTDRHRTAYHMHYEAADALILVRIDVRLIVQLIINLVNNAIKYTPPGSEIAVVAKKRGAWAEISVSDNGPGIPDSEKAHIFDMFYSPAHSAADSRRSLGLGLALCRSIVTAHGGTITVSDNAPHGAVFTFTLPAEEINLYA